ncbi:MAG: YggS family pyridoxal phosphate-dependent enzyme [Massiliimalia sp.]|jgi:pyridoxal phosphate enzyme (YggS family)
MTTNRSEQAVLEHIKTIQENVQKAADCSGRKREEISIMAVTKTVEPEYVNLAIEQGITLLGENRVQEFLGKRQEYHLTQAQVHFIGHLQTNKVKSIVDKVSMIESVSSLKLAQEIDRCAQKCNLVMPVLLEVNIGNEETKTGFSPEELWEILPQMSEISNISVQGLMCIPPKEDTEKFFEKMNQLFIDIKGKNIDNIHMTHLSMGMSADYSLAIAYGATIVRLGTALFGRRN